MCFSSHTGDRHRSANPSQNPSSFAHSSAGGGATREGGEVSGVKADSSHRHQRRKFPRERERARQWQWKNFTWEGRIFFLPASISGNTDKSSSKTIFCFWDDGLTYVTENAVMLVENRPAKMRGERWNLCNFQNVSRLPKWMCLAR